MEKPVDAVQNEFLRGKIDQMVRVITSNGYQQTGTLKTYDKYVIVVSDEAGRERMIYKSAISTIIE